MERAIRKVFPAIIHVNARFKVKSKIFKMNEPSSSESSPDHNLTDMGKFRQWKDFDYRIKKTNSDIGTYNRWSGTQGPVGQVWSSGPIPVADNWTNQKVKHF